MFLVGIPETRLPPPPEPHVGIYFILSFTLTLVQIVGTFAFQYASARYISKYIAEGDLEQARSIVSRVLQITLLSSLLFSASLLIFAEQISLVMTGSIEWTPLFRILAVTCFFAILFPQMLGFLQGLQKMRELAATSFIHTATQYLLGIFLLYMGLGLFGVLYGWLMGLVFSSLFGLILTAKFLGIFGKSHPMKPLIKFSYPLYISSILGYVASWVDQLFILIYGGEATLGVYGWAVKAAIIPSLIISSIITSLFPQLSELYTRYGRDTLRRAFTTSSRYAVLVGFPMFVGLAALANPAMAIFAGPEYSEAAIPLTIICLSMLFPTLGIAISSMLMAIERTKTESIVTFASIFSNTIVSYIGLAYLNLGMVGAALARLIASCVSFGLGVYALKRNNLDITFDWEVLWKASLACISMVVMVFLVSVFEKTISQLYLFPIYIILGAVTYFLSLVVLKAIKKQDVELIHDYLPGRFKRIAIWIGRLASIE